MKVTEVRIHPMDKTEGSLKGFASVTFDNAFVVHNVKIIEGHNGRFVAFPSNKGKDDKWFDICHPIDKAFREEVESAVLSEFEKASEVE